MPQLAKVGVLYERLGEDAVNEIAAWLDQVYDAKVEMDALRRDVTEVLREVRMIRLELSRDPPCRAPFTVRTPTSDAWDVDSDVGRPQIDSCHP
jgi:hypothetical protein